MSHHAFAHFVFVDFENVPAVNLDLPAEAAVKVVLLIGEKQKKLELGLVRQIHQHAARVQLIEVGAAGRNALDLTLAYHLGQTAAQHPEAKYHIVSKDKDFDPLIAHLRADRRQIFRYDEFSALPFLTTPASAAPRAKPAKNDERLDKLVELLGNAHIPRPARQKRLRSFINTTFGEKLTDAKIDEILASLTERGLVTIGATGRVSYRT